MDKNKRETYRFGVDGETLVVICDLHGVGDLSKPATVPVCGSNVTYKRSIGSVLLHRVLCGVGLELWRVVIDVNQRH